MLVASESVMLGIEIPECDLIISCGPPTSTESYIYRVGRTTTKDKAGTCITFYSDQSESKIKSIEEDIGAKITQITEPTESQLFEASQQSLKTNILDLDAKTISLFKKAARSLIKEKGDIEALSGALALLSGYPQ